MKGAANELSSCSLRSIILASNSLNVVSRDRFPRRWPVTKNTLRQVSGHAPRQSNRRPPIYTPVPRVSSSNTTHAGTRPSTANRDSRFSIIFRSVRRHPYNPRRRITTVGLHSSRRSF
ncbi:hypothetical protein Salat_2553500 [Sesamum alatum]|uniref:Uncharacterized protein n=1 Tax=Sesamum alatum TaxID=300844 RepID=A0AAE1XSK3_9LAMI|nr:hypothetical protein Salat_2553500 [Sesamum alatum]